MEKIAGRFAVMSKEKYSRETKLAAVQMFVQFTVQNFVQMPVQ